MLEEQLSKVSKRRVNLGCIEGPGDQQTERAGKAIPFIFKWPEVANMCCYVGRNLNNVRNGVARNQEHPPWFCHRCKREFCGAMVNLLYFQLA
jgi:hypothetical protein